MTTVDLPASIAGFVDELAGAGGVEAVVLGGSRAWGTADEASDWDLGVYYRGDVDLAAVAARGEVHRPGSWGRLMNGGAWLDLDGRRVDVLLRDLASVEHWTGLARQGRFEVDGLLGYVAGLPTYGLTAEVARCRLLTGSLDVDARFPAALAAAAPVRWRYHRDFTLVHAAKAAGRGDVVGTLAGTAKATLEEAHARHTAAGRWVVNEKRLLQGCGLDTAATLFEPGRSSVADLEALVAAVAVELSRPASPRGG